MYINHMYNNLGTILDYVAFIYNRTEEHFERYKLYLQKPNFALSNIYLKLI
jgi:hypothetical protein